MLPPLILCIDDRPELLKLRKTTLEQRGYTVETAINTTAAISVLANRPIAAVLVDYKLEGVDAQAAAYQIKQRYPSLPIILLSAYSEMPESLLWLVDEYVMKSEPPKLSEQSFPQECSNLSSPRRHGVLRRQDNNAPGLPSTKLLRAH